MLKSLLINIGIFADYVFLCFCIAKYPPYLHLTNMVSHISPAICDDIRVLEVAYWPNRRVIHEGRMGFYGLVLVITGRGQLQVGDSQPQAVGEGSYFLLHPQQTYRFGPECPGNWNQYHLSLCGSGLGRWIQTGLLPQAGLAHQLRRPNDMLTPFRQLMRLSEGQAIDKDRQLVALQQLLIELRNGTKQPTPPQTKVTNAMQAVANSMAEAPHESFDLTALSQEHGISLESLRKAFRRHLGLPPHRYLLRLRCQQAQRMLIHEQESLTTIATRCGFPSLIDFSRTYKKQMGLAPSMERVDHKP